MSSGSQVAVYVWVCRPRPKTIIELKWTAVFLHALPKKAVSARTQRSNKGLNMAASHTSLTQQHRRSIQSAQFPGGDQRRLPPRCIIACLMLFCFILHMASYPSMCVSEAERCACHIMMIGSDCVYLVIFPWFLCFNGWVSHIVSFLSILRSETWYRVCIGWPHSLRCSCIWLDLLYMHLDTASGKNRLL